MGIIEKIKEIENEMAKTQKNKATNSHLGRFQFIVNYLSPRLLLSYLFTDIVIELSSSSSSSLPLFDVIYSINLFGIWFIQLLGIHFHFFFFLLCCVLLFDMKVF